MNDINASSYLGLDFKGSNSHLLPSSSSAPPQVCPIFESGYSILIGNFPQPLRDSFFALIVPPTHNNRYSSFETAAKETTSYFVVRGDSVPEFGDNARKSTPYILTDIHRSLASQEVSVRKCYLALSFMPPVPGCGPETSKCMMFTLRQTETRKKRGAGGKVGEVNRSVEVYVVGSLDERMKQRVIRNKGKGKERETVNYGNEDDEEEWPRIDEDFINRARTAFSREFDYLQPMVPREHHDRLPGEDSGGVCAEAQLDAGPSELGSRPTIKTECGNWPGPVVNTGQGGHGQVQRDESYGVFMSATTGLSDYNRLYASLTLSLHQDPCSTSCSRPKPTCPTL